MTMWKRPSPEAMGWAPASERSRMARRRLARAARPSLDVQAPAPSGPRDAMASRVRSSSSRSMAGAASERRRMPLMPHMALGLDQPRQQRLQPLAEALEPELPLPELAARPAHPAGGAHVVEEAGQGFGQSFPVVRVDQQPGLAVDDDLPRGGTLRGENRPGSPHRLQVDEAEAL